MDLNLNQVSYLYKRIGYQVRSVSWKGHYKRLHLEANNGKIKSERERDYLDVPLSSCVTKGDTIFSKGKKVYVKCINHHVLIFPAYNSKITLHIGSLKVKATIKEITSQKEHSEYESLSKYHYRDKDIFGRTSRLIIKPEQSNLPEVLGYIELASPFYMNKPRSVLLDNEFHYNGTSWKTWNQETKKDNINLIVRISRCVVHPEFRGAGFGQLLVKHAEKFSKSRWQLGNYAPYFLEISADMLKYVSFAPKAGMHYIGDTQGNLHRVAKDMEYLTNNVDRIRSKEIVQEESCGIVDQQVSKMETFLKLTEKSKSSREELLTKLENLEVKDVLKDYAFFHEIVSLPKPTYIKGLNTYSEKFIKKNKKEELKSNFHQKINNDVKSIPSSIKIEDLTLTYKSSVRRTSTTHAIQQAFGISPDGVDNLLIKGLNCEFENGEIIFITGPSGSGKTTLLKVLENIKNEALEIDGKIIIPEKSKVGSFNQIKSKKALIEYFNSSGDINETIKLLSKVGLSDAYLFLKRYSELSKGQQFRAKLAELIDGNFNIWLIDEFCTNLDEVTANVVADKIQKISRELGVILIVAAANYKHFIQSLNPNKVLFLNSAWNYDLIPGSDFMDSCN